MPARTISAMPMRPEPKTMALGGVATGIMNAQLAAMAAGTSSSSGSTPAATATAASTGSAAAVVAVLLVNSVRNTIVLTTTSITISVGNPCSRWAPAPIHPSTPVSVTDAAAALAADADVAASPGYIVIADSSRGGATVVYHSSNLGDNGTETALVLLSGVAIELLTAANFVV